MNDGDAGSVRVAVFVAVAGLFAILLVAYTVMHRRPLIPADADHVGVAAPDQCLRCHGPGMKHARGRNHPLNDQCLQCHERA